MRGLPSGFRIASTIALIFPVTGCAAILGLDSGKDPADDAGANLSEAGDAGANADTGSGEDQDAGPKPPVCAPDTADCNGSASDGCETSLSNPQHCGDCKTVCGITQSCNASHCCTNDMIFCNANEDCCSGKCNGHKCGH